MGAIAYEYLIRKVYGCGRMPLYGADAIIYGRMEQSYQELQSQLINQREDRAFRESFDVVRVYVQDALNTLCNYYNARLTPDDAALVNAIAKEIGPNFYDKHRLDQLVITIGEMLSKYNGE